MKRSSLFVAVLGIFLFVQAAQADWQPIKRLTWNSGDSTVPRVAMDSSGILHLVWEDDTPGNYDVYYKKSADGGESWTSSRNLTWTDGSSSHPSIAVDSSDKLHVVYDETAPMNYEVYYRRSADGGDTWPTTKRLTWTEERSWDASIAVDSFDHLHVFWEDATPGNFEIYYRKSEDGGATWSASKRLTWTTGDSFEPTVAVDPSDNLHVAWYDYTPATCELYYKKSTDGGETWTATKRLTWTSGDSYIPSLISDASGGLHIAWEDEAPGNTEIYFRSSADGGTTWTTPKRLTWMDDASYEPDLSFDSSDGLHLVWSDFSPGHAEIYFKKSTNGGAGWTASRRITWTSGASESPDICVDPSGNIHVFWSDKTPGNYEIYYKRGN